MLSAFIEDPQELATLTPQIPEDFSYSPEAVEDDEAAHVFVERDFRNADYVAFCAQARAAAVEYLTDAELVRAYGRHCRSQQKAEDMLTDGARIDGRSNLPVYTTEECAASAALAQLDESDTAVTAHLAAVDTAPENVFDIVMYSLEPRWPASFREAEYRCSRWLVAARACEGTGLWPRYIAMEKAAERGTLCVDVELRTVCGAAWKAAGLHNIGKHLRPPKHRHHSEKRKIRQQRKRERPQSEDNRIRLWLCPEVKEQRAAEKASGIMRGTLR